MVACHSRSSIGMLRSEFGAVAAEILSSDYKRLIFISHTWPGTSASPAIPDGRVPFQKFYWDAQIGIWRGRRRDSLLRLQTSDFHFSHLARDVSEPGDS